jgi:small subunit ribosomal protein S4
MKLFLKGTRCVSGKCGITKRSYAPGQHGQARKKMSEYGLQLREKQKAKRYYGILESQVEGYYEMAVKKAGITGENLLTILESRLDNVVYRLGWATSRAEARQLVTHGHFKVNGGRVDIPSYLIKMNDTVTISDKSRKSEKIKAVLDTTDSKPVVGWLALDRDAFQASVIRTPAREDIDLEIEEHLIVELYSK